MDLDVHSAALEVFEKYKQLPEEAKKEVKNLILENQEDANISWEKRKKLVEKLRKTGYQFPDNWKFNRDELYDRI